MKAAVHGLLFFTVICIASSCVHQQGAKVDLAALVAKELQNKSVVYVEAPPRDKSSIRSINLCPKVAPGAYKDSALDEAVRVINRQNGVIDDCANKQLKALAEAYGLELHK